MDGADDGLDDDTGDAPPNSKTRQNVNSMLLGIKLLLNITDKTSFTTGLEFLNNLDPTSDYLMETDLALNFTLTDTLSLSFKYRIDYDRNPPTGKVNSDNSFKIALGAEY